MKQSISQLTEETAKNLYEFMIQLSDYIQKLESQNKSLKEKNEQYTSDQSQDDELIG